MFRGIQQLPYKKDRVQKKAYAKKTCAKMHVSRVYANSRAKSAEKDMRKQKAYNWNVLQRIVVKSFIVVRLNVRIRSCCPTKHVPN